jgi:CDP-paratose 2-epimerase
MKKIIVTGAAGFIGCHTAARLLKEGIAVIGVDNLSRAGSTSNLAWLQSQGGNFRFYHADIRSAADVERVFAAHRDANAVIHEAAQVAVTTAIADPRNDFEINALGTFNVLEATRRLLKNGAHFLHASTNKVYGKMDHLKIVEQARRYAYENNPKGVAETEPLDFHSPYGCSKGAAEQYVNDYGRIYGLRCTVFRQSCIYGTRQFGMEDQGWVAWFTIAAVLDKPVTIYGDGKQLRDLLWVDDLVNLYLAALAKPEFSAGKIYNAGGGEVNTLSLLELVTLLSARLKSPLRPRFSDWRPGDQKVFVADSYKAASELGWKPQVSPKEGVNLLFDWVTMHRDLLQALNNSDPLCGVTHHSRASHPSPVDDAPVYAVR